MRTTTTISADDAGAGAGGAGGGGGEGGAGAGDGAAAAAEKPYYETFADEGLRSSQTIQRYKTPEELAKGFLNLEKRFGIPENRRIDLPEDLTSAEAMRPVYERLGMPAKVEGYAEAGVKMPDGASEADKKTLDVFLPVFHQLGLSAAQAKGIFDVWAKTGAEGVVVQQAAYEERRTEGTKALRGEWGQAAGAREKELERLVKAYDPDGKVGLTFGENANWGAHPELGRMLLRMADRMGEAGDPGNEGAGGGAGHGRGAAMSPAQAKAALETLKADPVKGPALINADHQMHKQVVAERRRLLALSEGRDPDAA